MTRLLPTPAIVAQARSVVANPGPHLTPQQRLLAWHILKSDRGQAVNQTRLCRDQRARRTPLRPTTARAQANDWPGNRTDGGNAA